VGAERFETEGHTLRLSISAGVAVFDGSASLEQTLKAADDALYAAKAAGRDRVAAQGAGAGEAMPAADPCP